MKKKIFSLFVALMATVAVQAQIISVVSPSGATSLYRTLPEAIKGAANGSVVYLPGGGFTIPDSVKITKKLTIIGIGSKANSDNVDGATTINGNLYFNQGSDGSAVMSCKTGNVYIGEDGQVNDVLVKHCWNQSIVIKTDNCTGTIISQNNCNGSISGGTGTCIKNNVIICSQYGIKDIKSGFFANNIILCLKTSQWASSHYPIFSSCSNSVAIGNILSNYMSNIENTSGNACINQEWGFNPINFQASNWEDVFVNFKNGATSFSLTFDFHFKDEYKQYESQVGIYAGEGFNDGQMAPVPYIMYKDVPDKTDAEGKLKVKIRVKANQ